MGHSRIRRIILALAVVFIAPATGLAGPIEWGYLANIHPDASTGRLRIGSVPGAGGSQEVVASLRGEFVDGPGMLGSQRFAVASLLDIDVHTADAGTPPSQNHFLLDVDITDVASGDSGRVSIFGFGEYLGDDLLMDRRVMLELAQPGVTHTLQLGNTRYDIAFSVEQGTDMQGNPDHISTIWADVTVTQTTPEPTTLALAGLGLGGLGVVRRLRRSAAA